MYDKWSKDAQACHISAPRQWVAISDKVRERLFIEFGDAQIAQKGCAEIFDTPKDVAYFILFSL